MRPSWCLPPLAALFLGGALWIAFRGERTDPAQLCASAKARLAGVTEETEFEAAQRARGLARHEIDLGLRYTLDAPRGELRAELLGLRAALNEKEGLYALALEDCRARLELGTRDADTLARTCALLLRQGEPGQALAFAAELAELEPARGRAYLGSAHVDLSDVPLRSVERLAQTSLSPARAARARVLARRAAALSGEENLVAPAREELLELFTRADERRLAGEWVREAGSELGAARADFLASLERGTTSLAVVGLQDLCLRAGLEDEAAELGSLALAQPELADPMRLLARTSAALTALGRERAAQELLRLVQNRLKGRLRHDEIPSEGLNDELADWCGLLERLEAWGELGQAAWTLLTRAGDDRARNERARILLATAALRTRNLPMAQQMLDALGTSPIGDPRTVLESGLLQAELAHGLKSRSRERFALLSLLRTAPLDPEEPLRSRLGRAWERLSELQVEDGELLAASDSLTHALRCSHARAAALEPRWHELGRRATAASAGLPTSYGLYLGARWELEGGRLESAAEVARLLLEAHPGLAPGLEIASAAAQGLNNYPRMIETSLEILARGWPAAEASARLRSAPLQYLLPQDRVRWLELDPRGALEAVVRRLLARGDGAGAARAVRNAPLKEQPAEILPLLARTLLASGDDAMARATLAALPAESPAFRRSTGLALELAARSATPADPAELTRTLTRVLASGQPEDPELVPALGGWIADGWRAEAAELAAWMMDERTPFLGEALLARAALDALGATHTSESLERAAALVEDGRAELGALILLDAAGASAELRAAARAALATPLAAEPGRELALLLLAGETERAADLVAAARFDGRATTLELAAACAAALAPEALAAEGAPARPAPAFLFESLAPERYLLLVLAADLPPWSAWARATAAALPPAVAADPHLVALRVQAALALGRHAAGLGELTQLTERPEQGERMDVRLAWLRARLLRASGAAEDACEEAELAWLERSGHSEGEADEHALELARLWAARAERRGDVPEAVRILERARAEATDAATNEASNKDSNADQADAELLERLARLENTPGRRVRAFELYAELLTATPVESGDPRVLACLELLRTAREEGEISERRWWAEVEALEAERPEDPAPARELATRSFEQPGALGENGRALALARLERFRTRTLDRPVESLRTGEALRWTRLLARFTPEGAVQFAEEELRRDPADPSLWHASAEALVAAGRAREAIERLEAISLVAPSTETTRLLLQLRYGLDRNAEAFHRHLASMRRLDPDTKDDVVLLFLGHLADLEGRGTGLKKARELWTARATNALASSDFGRLLAIALHQKGAPVAALQVLQEARAYARSALEAQVLVALGHLIQSASAAVPREGSGQAAAADDGPAADDGLPLDAGPAREVVPDAGAALAPGPAPDQPAAATPAEEPATPKGSGERRKAKKERAKK